MRAATRSGELIKERFPATMAQRSFMDALQSLSSELPPSIQFLGIDLPLPASECDFNGDLLESLRGIIFNGRNDLA